MALYQRDSENADRNLTSLVTVLTDTVDVSGQYVVRIKLGDGAKDLDGTGGDFKLVLTIGGQTAQPSPQVVTFSTAVRGYIETPPFTALAGEEVIARVLSPNAADTDVDVTASLHDVTRAVPAAAPDAAGGLPISDAGGLSMDFLLLNRITPPNAVVRQLGSAAYPVIFFMTDEDNPVLGKTGLAPTVTVSKNGAGFAAAAGAVAEVGEGWYRLAANAGDRDTLGELAVHAEAVGANDTDLTCTIVSYNPFDAVRLGLTGIPNANAGANGGLPTIDASLNVRADLRAVEGSATIDAVSLTVWAARLFQALVRPFTGNAVARTIEHEDNTGATAFTHTFTNDGNNSRSLS